MSLSTTATCLLKYLQGWWLNLLCWAACSDVDNPFYEETFPNIQTKPTLGQLEATSSCPDICNLGEKADTHFETTSFPADEESNKISLKPPFLQAKQPRRDGC